MVKPLSMGVVALSMLCGTLATGSQASNGKANTDRFYMSLGYGPAISRVSDFKVGIDGETKGVFQHHERNNAILRHSENFYWDSSVYPNFKFKNYSMGFKGGVGFMASGLRVEVELGHERSDIVKTGMQRQKKGESIPFVLGKGVVVDVTKPQMGVYKYHGAYKEAFEDIYGYVTNDKRTHRGFQLDSILTQVRHFLNASNNMQGVTHQYPNLQQNSAIARYATNVAVVFGTLPPEQRRLFARTLAMSVEGAEVLDISAIKNTTVSTNLCYDFPEILGLKLKAYPYVCGGLGGSFVGITDNHINMQLSYKLKLGLNYNFYTNCIAYIGATYQKVVGEDYDEIPLSRLVDDRSPLRKARYFTGAKFGLNYISFEVGSRVTF